MTIDDAYLIFKDDFKHRNWVDWLAAHIMLAPPPYRFKGSISLKYDGITFNGYDTYLKEEATFNITKGEIIQLYHGYDKTFSLLQTRGLGMGLAPIRIRFDATKFDDNENETDLYLVVKYNGIYSGNEKLFEELQNWLQNGL